MTKIDHGPSLWPSQTRFACSKLFQNSSSVHNGRNRQTAKSGPDPGKLHNYTSPSVEQVSVNSISISGANGVNVRDGGIVKSSSLQTGDRVKINCSIAAHINLASRKSAYVYSIWIVISGDWLSCYRNSWNDAASGWFIECNRFEQQTSCQEDPNAWHTNYFAKQNAYCVLRFGFHDAVTI